MNFNEKHLKDMSRHPKEEIFSTPYKASMGDEYSTSFIAASWVESSSFDKTMERQIVKCAENRCIKEAEREDLQVAEHGVKNVATKMYIFKHRKSDTVAA